MRSQVAIIGAGPAGLLLSQLLAADGVKLVVLETRSRGYVGARILRTQIRRRGPMIMAGSCTTPGDHRPQRAPDAQLRSLRHGS
jgi:2-polyprenyl-6-methoxyphenol hydroxylase-like FAD-dependent oxidoreductase